MNTALLAFLVVISLFVIVTLYIFSRIRQIHLRNDASRPVMTTYLVAGGVIIALVLLFLGRP